MLCAYVFFFKQKTAYEMRISDWSSDVCSSDLLLVAPQRLHQHLRMLEEVLLHQPLDRLALPGIEGRRLLRRDCVGRGGQAQGYGKGCGCAQEVVVFHHLSLRRSAAEIGRAHV